MFVFMFFDAANGLIYLAAFSGLGGRQEGHPACKKTEWWGARASVVSHASVKSRLVLPFWYRVTG